MKPPNIVRAVLVMLFSLVCNGLSATGAIATPRLVGAANSNVYINLPSHFSQSQVLLLMDYTGNIGPKSLVFKGSGVNVTLMNPINCYSSPPNTPITNIWYFSLAPGQTAQLTNYATTPMHFALWAPVDSSATGQESTTCWFTNYCFGPSTFGAPANAKPAGATFVEVNLSNSVFDTVDISEVNGVNAAWSVALPGHWSNDSYRDHYGHLIPVSAIANKPGNRPFYYGDYGNPGVYPFGCTNCASRYDNEVLRSGCLASESQPPVTYPSNDVGCDNAINYYPNNIPYSANNTDPAFEGKPSGVHKLPIDAFAPGGLLYNLTEHPPSNEQQKFYGYGICNILRGKATPDGSITVLLNTYPFGQTQ